MQKLSTCLLLLAGVSHWVSASGLGELRPPSQLEQREIFQPQLFQTGNGTLLLIWRQKQNRSSDLFASTSRDGSPFREPVQLNLPGSSVASVDLDEIRPAVAVGPGGRVAVAWGGDRGDILAVISGDSGQTFTKQIRLNQDTSPAYRGFPAIAFDYTGQLHGIWIDARFAPRGAEEPADLYYARLSGEKVTEMNLTESQESSICGCCRPHLEITETGEILATFRNTTADGYRDIFRITGDLAGNFEQPVRFGPPMWELEGCPMAGPLGTRAGALWLEASTGKRRLLAANQPNHTYSLVLQDHADWKIQRPPRIILSAAKAPDLLLLPGHPYGLLLARRGEEWHRLEVEVPDWATSGVRQGEEVLLIGTEARKLRWTVQNVAED